MKIKDMFEHDIDRNINGVIKVDQEDDGSVRQELSEYVVTDELRRHFKTLFDVYVRALDAPTDKVGVWISGSFGSGKSHFLKMLSYLFTNREAAGKTAIEYIAPRFEDDELADKAKRAAGVTTDAILFNMGIKSPLNKDGSAVARIFAKMYYESRGFYGADFKLALWSVVLTTPVKLRNSVPHSKRLIIAPGSMAARTTTLTPTTLSRHSVARAS